MARRGPSAPLRWLQENELLISPILDFGCGRGADVAHLQSLGFKCWGTDKFHKGHLGFQNAAPWDKPLTICCTYVLNVILCDEERADVLKEVATLLNPEGVAYFTVRRDIPEEGTPTQRWVELSMPSIHRTRSFEIYEFNPSKLCRSPSSSSPE